MLKIKNYNNIFFVGLGGISMSGLAILLKASGKQVSGSDICKSQTTKKLKKQKPQKKAPNLIKKKRKLKEFGSNKSKT